MAHTVHALDTMRALAAKGEVRDVEAGSVIFRAGEDGVCMFGLLEGTVRLSWNADAGHEDIQAGDVFGAGALVTAEHRRFGHATALTACRLLVMNRENSCSPSRRRPCSPSSCWVRSTSACGTSRG